MGMFSSLGGMVGGVVGGMFGGPIGAQIGQMIGSGIGQALEGLISQHGQSNVQGAMSNSLMGSLVNQLTQGIQCGMPGMPQFQKDALCQALQEAAGSCPQAPTTPGCQRDVNDEMGSFIDQLAQKIAEHLMNEMQNGGGCDAGSGSRADVATSSSANDSSGSKVGDTADVGSSLLNKCSRDEEKEKAKSEGCSSGAGSWLVALAKAMGEMTGNHLQKMMQAQDKMEASEVTDAELKGKSDEEKSKIKQEKGKEFTQAQAEFQAESKLFAMCSEATSTVLKSVGEGLSSMARKQ